MNTSVSQNAKSMGMFEFCENKREDGQIYQICVMNENDIELLLNELLRV